MGSSEAWDVLRREWALVAVVAVAGLVVAVLLVLFLPWTYTSTATFAVATSGPTTPEEQDQRVRSWVEVLDGSPAAADASRLLGGQPSPERIEEAVEGSPTDGGVELRVTDTSPRTAQLVAEAVGVAFTRIVARTETVGRPANRPAASVVPLVPPTAPGTASFPRPGVVLPLGLLVGLVLGLLSAFARAVRRRDAEGFVMFSRPHDDGSPAAGPPPLEPPRPIPPRHPPDVGRTVRR